MSAAPLRRRLAVTAAASSTALLLAACSSAATNPPQSLANTTASTSSTTTTSAATAAPAPSTPGIQWAAGTPLISDGSATLTIGGVPVTFPTKVTEAAWSPDGSRIAFIDGDGNVSTARPDGSSLVVLVKPAKGAKLSDPVWAGGGVVYVEQSSNGSHSLRAAAFPDQRNHDDYDTNAFIGQDLQPLPETAEPAAAWYSDINGDYDAAAFEHQGTKGPEIWFHTFDSNSRGGANPAQKAFDGSWPAIGGHDLAFVGANGQIEVSKGLPQYGSGAGGDSLKATQITTAAVKPTHLTWTADGKSVAYSTPTGIESVSIDTPNATPVKVSDKPGVVSYLPAATDQLATFAGTDATDLTGASIALSQWRWATQTSMTPEPAGGGPHGPFGMTVTLVVGTDPAVARRQADWAGMYGPVLVVRPGPLDARVIAEIKRVLGKPVTTDPAASSFSDVDEVYIVDPASAIPKSADTAIQSLGYTPARITKEPATKHEANCLLIADQNATADVTLATDAGCRIMTLTGGALSTADAAALPHQGFNGILATSPAAASAVLKAASTVPYLDPHVVTLPTTPGLPDFSAALADARHATTLTVIPAGSPKDALLARTENLGTTAVIDPVQGISPTLKTFLDQDSASIDTVTIIDTDTKLPADLRKQIGTLVSGPLGPATVTNPTADARPKAF